MIMNGPHVRIVQRQGLGGGGLLGGLNSAVSNAGSDLTSAVAGAGSDLTSGLGDITSAVIPTTSASTASSTTPISTTQTSSTTLQSTSSTATSSTSTFTSTRSSSSTSSSSSSSSTSSSSSSSSSTSSSSTSSSTITSSSSASVVVSTSDGVQETITAFVTSSASPSPSSMPPSSSTGGFLNNKPLEGFVFALCGIVGIIVVFVVATFALRRSRRKKMINEALSYEPTTTHGYRDEMERGLAEKARHSYTSNASLGSGNGPPVAAYPGTYGYEREYPAYAPRSPVPYGPPYGGGPAYDVNQMGPAHAQANLPRVPAPAMSTDIGRV